MAHFAQIDENNLVTNVIVVANSDTGGGDLDREATGIAFCKNLAGDDTNWKQTSYNHNFRGNYAGIGCTYMENVQTLGVASTDIFIDQQPYASWTVGIQTAEWYAPLGKPGLTTTQMEDGYYYKWDEAAYQADNNVGWALTQYNP